MLLFIDKSGGECLTAKRTVKAEGRNLSACGAGRAEAFPVLGLKRRYPPTRA